MFDFYEMDAKVKVLAKTLREYYKSQFKDERFYTITSTKSEKKQIFSLSCYPKDVTDIVLNDYKFKSFLEKNNLKYELEFKEKTRTYKINLSLLESD